MFPEGLASIVGASAQALPWWTGGHLGLDLGVLPRALRDRSAAVIRSFEETFEPLGLTGLAWHIRGITALAIAFVVVGGLIRLMQ